MFGPFSCAFSHPCSCRSSMFGNPAAPPFQRRQARTRFFCLKCNKCEPERTYRRHLANEAMEFNVPYDQIPARYIQQGLVEFPDQYFERYPVSPAEASFRLFGAQNDSSLSEDDGDQGVKSVWYCCVSTCWCEILLLCLPSGLPKVCLRVAHLVRRTRVFFLMHQLFVYLFALSICLICL